MYTFLIPDVITIGAPQVSISTREPKQKQKLSAGIRQLLIKRVKAIRELHQRKLEGNGKYYVHKNPS